MTKRVAVVGVPGVAPHPRYEFQDQVAGLLRDRLNESAQSDAWHLEVINPKNVLPPGTDDPRPTITRVSSGGSDVSYDVTEAYWSPLDKGATNWFLVLTWIFRTVFAPFNTVARIESSLAKQFFDYTFIGIALLIAFALFGFSLYASWISLLSILAITGLFHKATVSDTISELNATTVAPGGHPVSVILWIFGGILGAFFIGQAIAALFKTWQQRKALLHNRVSLWHRAWPIALLSVAGAGLVYGMAITKFAHGSLGWVGVSFIVLTFLAFQIGRGLLVNFIVEFFGDVQIYTTRDENESKFFGIRDQIMDASVTAIMQAVSPRMNGGVEYDRVIVLAHSLGATIATDAIVRLKQACEQGALTPEEFGRIRAFVMAGSSLEKTQYFFNAAGVAPTISGEAWRGDAYPRIFDDAPSLMCGNQDDKIFWANYWYFADPICNEVQSYADICRNQRLKKSLTLWHPLLHSDYLYDPRFWYSSKEEGHLGTLDIITGAGAQT